MQYDEFGPEKVVEVYDPKTGMKGVLVIDNTVLGPGKGGIRMTPTVDKEEVFRLARTMTWKNSMAGLPFGGAKSGIIFNPKEATNEKKQEIVTSFANALKRLCPSEYIAAPDMNTTEEEMRTFATANGNTKSCTGKPADMGGIPHELGSTGFGVYHATKVAAKHLGIELNGATVAIEGFGNVGQFAAKFLEKEGVKLVGVSDSKGTLYVENGIDVEKLLKVKQEERTVTKYGEGTVLSAAELAGLQVDILITAAIPDFINGQNHEDIKAKLIVEGSNIAMTPSLENHLFTEHGIVTVPDFVANAGGVISSYVEHIGGTPEDMFKLVEEKITENTNHVMEEYKKHGITTRDAAMKIAQRRVKECKRN